MRIVDFYIYGNEISNWIVTIICWISAQLQMMALAAKFLQGEKGYILKKQQCNVDFTTA